MVVPPASQRYVSGGGGAFQRVRVDGWRIQEAALAAPSAESPTRTQHCPRSRNQTTRLTALGMWRDGARSCRTSVVSTSGATVRAPAGATGSFSWPGGWLPVAVCFPSSERPACLIRSGTDWIFVSTPVRPGAGFLRGLGHLPELALLDLLAEQSQGPLEDRARVTVRDLTPQERLDRPQIVVGFLADRELDPVRCGASAWTIERCRGGLGDGADKTNRSWPLVILIVAVDISGDIRRGRGHDRRVTHSPIPADRPGQVLPDQARSG